MSTRVTLKMKLDIFSAMQKLSLSFFSNNQTGGLITRVNYGTGKVRGFFINAVPALVISSINFIGLTIFLFYYRLETDADSLYSGSDYSDDVQVHAAQAVAHVYKAVETLVIT